MFFAADLTNVRPMMPVDLAAAAAATLADLVEERRHLALLLAGLDLIDQGFTVMDADLRLVAANRGLFKLFGFPPEMSRVGTPFADFVRYNAERGEYGEGDVEAIVAEQASTRPPIQAARCGARPARRHRSSPSGARRSPTGAG